MSFETVRSTILSRFENNWTTTEIEWPNIEFTTKPDTAYVRIAVLYGTSQQASMGTAIRQYRHVGLLTFSIFIPEGTGSLTGIQYADSISSIWRGQTLTGGIIFRSPGIVPLGKVQGWVQTNVTIPFQWDEFI